MKDEELYKKEEINSQKINIDVLPLLSKLYHGKLVVIIVTIILSLLASLMPLLLTETTRRVRWLYLNKNKT